MAYLSCDFDLFITPDGIFLRMNCTDKTVTNADVIDRYLTSSGIKVYDRTALAEALKKFESTTIKIAKNVVDVVDEHIYVTTDEDDMTAYIQFMPPSSNGKEITVEDVKKQLKEAGVIVGIKDMDIPQIVEDRSYFIEYEIAKGVDPIEGTPSFIEYKFNPEVTNERKPKVNDDGSVDYHTMEIINPVNEGDLLAVVEPAIPGVDGKSVYGQPVPPKIDISKELTIFAGRNVRVTEDKKQAYAAREGQVLVDSGRIVVDDVYFVNGDVDAKTGNIAFNGSVVVNGSVRSGFKIEAKGEIQIEGTVEAAFLHSEKSILIKGGIQGMSKAKLFAKENIISKFIENASVICNGDVETGNVLYSDIVARNKVEMNDKRGLITGGTITAGREIICKNVGTEMGSMTVLQVGRNKDVRNAIKQAKEEIKELESRRLGMLKIIKFYKEKLLTGDKLDSEEELRLKELIKKQKKIVQSVEQRNNKIEIMQKIMEQEEGKTERIICMNNLSQDVKLAVNGAVMITRRSYNAVAAVKFKDDVRLCSYSPDDNYVE